MYDYNFLKTAVAAGWGLVVDEWLEATLGDLTKKALRSRKVKLRIIDPIYRKDVGYFRSRLGGEQDGKTFNLNLHLEFVSGIGVKFSVDVHGPSGLNRVAEAQADYNDPARRFDSALASALRMLPPT